MNQHRRYGDDGNIVYIMCVVYVSVCMYVYVCVLVGIYLIISCAHVMCIFILITLQEQEGVLVQINKLE